MRAWVFGVVLGCLWGGFATAVGERVKPDVLMIVVDDLNDWITVLDPEAPIAMANLDRLAKRGMLFTRAYCLSAACNPSRVGTLLGQRPTTTGVYSNRQDVGAADLERRTLMEQFRAGGYAVKGAGKIFHHKSRGAASLYEACFDDFQVMGPQNMPPKKLNGAPEYGSRNTDWGVWPQREEETIDYRTASYCVEALKNPPADKPLFLACGIFKPHSPFFAPPQWHQGAGARIPMPVRRDDDWKDLPGGARVLMRDKKWFWNGMMKLERRLPGSYRNFVSAYAACCRFADSQIGRVLDALDASPRKENTIVVLWSDHGFHLGEKDHIEKFALWEKSNHIPFIVSVPGMTRPRSVCSTPVDMTVLYPTLLELAGLPADDKCDGASIVPLLKNPEADWERPAVMTYGRGNHAVRSEEWRYIRYADGTEELYDHGYDRREWFNMASYTVFAEVLERHRAWLPVEE